MIFGILIELFSRQMFVIHFLMTASPLPLPLSNHKAIAVNLVAKFTIVRDNFVFDSVK